MHFSDVFPETKRDNDMTIGLQAYLHGYMHEKTAARGSSLTGGVTGVFDNGVESALQAFQTGGDKLSDKLFGEPPAPAPMTEEEEKWWQRMEPVEKLTQEMDELNFQMRAMSPEEQAVAIQKHSELQEQRDMLEAQIYAEQGYEKTAVGPADGFYRAKLKRIYRVT
jgi:hypothetical protein